MDEFLGTMTWIIGVALVLGLLIFGGIYGCAQIQTQGQLIPPAIHGLAWA